MPRPLPEHVREATGGEAQAVREHILAAAYRVITVKGLAAASTRAIAAEADIAAGTMYNYFDNHLQLIARTLLWKIQKLSKPVSDLPQRAGKHTVAANLRHYARRIGPTLDELVPLGAAAFSDPVLLEAMRVEHANVESIHDSVEILHNYLKQEQLLGRIAAGADCRAAAAVVFRICHDHAFHRFLEGSSFRIDAIARELDFVAKALVGEDG